MCCLTRMNTNSGTNSSWLSKINVLGLFSNSKKSNNAGVNVKMNTNNSRKIPNINVANKPVLPVTARGGATSQPSEAIMKWATTAGVPSPVQMRNVAHGGKRRTIYKRNRKTKRSTGGKKHILRRKTHRRRGA